MPKLVDKPNKLKHELILTAETERRARELFQEVGRYFQSNGMSSRKVGITYNCFKILFSAEAKWLHDIRRLLTPYREEGTYTLRDEKQRPLNAESFFKDGTLEHLVIQEPVQKEKLEEEIAIGEDGYVRSRPIYDSRQHHEKSNIEPRQ